MDRIVHEERPWLNSARREVEMIGLPLLGLRRQRYIARSPVVVTLALIGEGVSPRDVHVTVTLSLS